MKTHAVYIAYVTCTLLSPDAPVCVLNQTLFKSVEKINQENYMPSHGVISQGSTLRGPVAVALRLCPIQGLG